MYNTIALRLDGSSERNLVQLCVGQDSSPPFYIILQAIATPRMNLIGSGAAHRMTPEKCLLWAISTKLNAVCGNKL